MATVGVTGVVGAVSAVYYKIPSPPLPLGVRCRCGLHRKAVCSVMALSNRRVGSTLRYKGVLPALDLMLMC